VAKEHHDRGRGRRLDDPQRRRPQRVFNITGAQTVTISGLTMTGGTA